METCKIRYTMGFPIWLTKVNICGTVIAYFDDIPIWKSYLIFCTFLITYANYQIFCMVMYVSCCYR